MTANQTEQQLHDRATRGEPLSADERQQLQAWYARLDHEEHETISRPAPPPSLVALHAQIETALAQVATVTERIQTLSGENAALRREIVSMQARLAQKPTPQPA